MTETEFVHCNGTNDQFYLNIKTLLFLQKQLHIFIFTPFWDLPVFSYGEVCRRQVLMRGKPVAKPSFIFCVEMDHSYVKDSFVYSINEERSHGEHMKFICEFFFNEILFVLLKLSEL